MIIDKTEFTVSAEDILQELRSQLILNHIELLSTKSDFKLPKNPNEVISLKEMNFNLKVNTIRIILSLNINKNFFNKLRNPMNFINKQNIIFL